MSPLDRPRSLRTAALPASIAAPIALFIGLTLALTGCDNPACVFGGVCNSSGGGALGDNPASQPLDDEWIETGAPIIQDIFPVSGTPVDIHTPVVIVFSESLRPGESGSFGNDLVEAFGLRTPTAGTIGFSTGALVGNGRMLVLFPEDDLQPSTTYAIVMSEGAVLLDRTGQSVTRPSLGDLSTFTTATTPTAAPKLIATWPKDLSLNQSAKTEIVAVFDRNMDPSTVTTASFAVTVDPLPPVFDPDVRVLSVGNSDTDPRVFVWRNLEPLGGLAPLGEDADVDVALSPVGHVIEDSGGAALLGTTFGFFTAPFSAPLSAAITSDPTDAIGIDAISGPADLAIRVELSGAEAGDFLVLTMFGTDPDEVDDPELFALRRQVTLTPPFDSFTLTAEEIDLLASSNPVRGRFADGSVAFAFQVGRNLLLSPVRLLDVDPAEDDVQDPILDATRPVLLGLGTTGASQAILRSDVRDVVLVGRSSEPILRASVVTSLGNNEITPGVVPPVVGSAPSGLFVAAPVRAGVLTAAEEQLDFTLTIYDRAMNSAVAQSSPTNPNDGFRQLGASGPGTALPGGTVSVEVFDTVTLNPVPGASVYVHQILGGVISPVNATPGITDAAGLAIVPAAPTRTTMVTVSVAGYDLFTFQGVPTSRLGIPLTPAGLSAGTASGTVGPLEQGEAADLNSLARSVADSRRLDFGPSFAPVSFCNVGSHPPDYECPFGPISIQPGRIGAQSAITTVLPAPTIFDYSALTFLKTAALSLPKSAVPSGGTEITAVPIDFLLDAGGVDAEERPIDVPQHLLSTAAWPGLPGEPVITVEATSPGIPAAVMVGRGVAFDDSQPADTWVVRAAYPGSADGSVDFPGDELGNLVADGTIDSDLLLGVEVEDAAGNRGGARPRFSLSALSLVPPPPPILPANPIAPNTGQGFDLTFPDVLPDAVSAPAHGFYRIRLTDSAGRSWTVYLPDPEDLSGPDVHVHLPDLGANFPLASGEVDCQISAWSWPTLNFSEFLWTDIEREHDLSVHSAVQNFTLP